MDKATALNNLLNFCSDYVDEQYEDDEWDDPSIKKWKEDMDKSIEIATEMANEYNNT